MKILSRLVVAISLCLLAGCESTPKTYTHVMEGMSRNNLRFWFGEPLRIESKAGGSEDWYYRFSSWESKPTGSSETRNDFGQQTTQVSAGLEFAQRVDELPVHLSADGFVVRPVPEGRVVK